MGRFASLSKLFPSRVVREKFHHIWGRVKNVSITSPNVVVAAGVRGSILDFFNIRKAKEQQKQLDENVKSLTLVTEELRNVTGELNKSKQVLQSKVDAIQAPSRPPWPLSLFW